MKPRWSRSLDEQAKKEMERDFASSILIREKLQEILEEEIDKSLKEMRDVAKNRNVSSLTEYYADELSKQRTLEYVISLIK
jgi:Zn-dependent peptidase ImmA (M78 family)